MMVFMGSVSLVVGHRQELGLRLLLYWLAWERNWVWTRGSVSWRAVDYVRSPFSQELYVDHVRYLWSWSVACWSGLTWNCDALLYLLDCNSCLISLIDNC
jgi:hypothetical protein